MKNTMTGRPPRQRGMRIREDLRLLLVHMRRSDSTTLNELSRRLGYKTDRLAAVVDDPENPRHRILRTKHRALEQLLDVELVTMPGRQIPLTNEFILRLCEELQRREISEAHMRFAVGVPRHHRRTGVITAKQKAVIRDFWLEDRNTMPTRGL